MNLATAETKETEELLVELSSSLDGLSQALVLENKEKFGKNVLLAHEVRWWNILLRQFSSSFVYLLIGASVISLLLGERIDSIIIILFVAINSILGFWQEYKATNSLANLKKLVTRTSKVRRNKEVLTVNDDEIVVGDILILQAGDLIPADVRFLSGTGISTDESILTGESVTQSKIANALKEPLKDLTEAKNMGFSGTLVTTGEAEAVVIAVGNSTELGKISKLMLETETQSGFSKRIKTLSGAVIWLMVSTLGVVLLLHLILKGPSINIGELAIFSIALAVGVIPEALPLVITISLSSGALRLAKKGVVPKRLSSIEDLGSIDILCTDKTGTITENRLSVTEMLSKDNETLLKRAFWGSTYLIDRKPPTNPFDKAIWEKLEIQADRYSDEVESFISELPFDPIRRRNTVLLRLKDGRELIISRGAYDEIVSICSNTRDNKTLEWIKEKEKNGDRILAIASKFVGGLDPKNLTNNENNLELIGLLSFNDPLKETAKEAIVEAEKLGVTIKMLTGDSPDVAIGIGKTIGLINENEDAILGKDYEQLSEEEKNKAVINYQIFARVNPEQKFDILRRLQKNHTVGFLGEGFNDAPGLKVAHVGLVVDNASDVAKDAADVILLSKDLKTIIDGIKEGRTTFTNTIKYIRATLTSNFGNFFAIAFSSLFVPFLPMLPIQILLVNLLTDFPMVSVSTDNVNLRNLRKPKKYSIRSIIILAVVVGLISTAFDFVTFGYFVRFGERTLQTMWFMESILTELVLVFSIRTSSFFLKSTKPGALLSALSVLTVVVTLWIPFSKLGQTFFGFTQPQTDKLITVFILVLIYFVATEATKLIYYKLKRADV